ncbi:MAG: hypothetical protein Tsb009_16850 [Planctomycetaceae bacterium]
MTSTSALDPNGLINRLAIDLGHSLLQYLGEAWPWSDANHREEHSKIDELVARQSELVDRLLNLLQDRDWAIESGTYPTEFTDLQYLSLEFLLDRTIENAELHVELLEDCRSYFAASPDEQAAALVEDVLSEQKKIVAELKELAASIQKKNAG